MGVHTAVPLSEAHAYGEEELVHDEQGQVLEEEGPARGEGHLRRSHPARHALRLAQGRQSNVLSRYVSSSSSSSPIEIIVIIVIMSDHSRRRVEQSAETAHEGDIQTGTKERREDQQSAQGGHRTGRVQEGSLPSGANKHGITDVEKYQQQMFDHIRHQAPDSNKKHS